MISPTSVRALVLACLTAAGTACAPAAPAEPAASPGCGRPAPAPPGQSVTRTVDSGGVKRSYLLHLPADYQPDRPRWLVLSFHGHKRTPEYQEQLTGMSATDAITVYPQGLVGTDGETAWSGAPYSAPVDDVRFTADLIDALRGELCVDPARVYATGKSNGGGFVGLLACRLPDRIAAFAPVSGAFYPEGGPCNPPRPASILDFHGTADPTIPYRGIPAKGLPALPEWLAGWAARDGCATPPGERTEHGGTVRVFRWQPCGQGTELEHYRVEGLGHDWPSTRPNLDSEVPTVLDATPVIMEFFARHPLRQTQH
ncbi:PHB depolymerase family esterase [Pseudonocardia eucalypti]|uniref:PHB depolymerase family esterase n=1 Tax=Pseudonocardia eucalypti TaxID=648755 RepID=A0ABP9PPB6_9PSEU|nr:polyhydroxybutyrate depolymerase [Pseudonocardia eucalypti]